MAIGALCTAGLVLGCSAAKHAARQPAKHAAQRRATLHLHGTHPVGADYHQGTFTASRPLCPSGKWLGNGAGTRVFTCSDHSGRFRATFEGELEHVQGASGPWTIADGTDTYTGMRGSGTATLVSPTGFNSSPITFSDTWTGVVELKPRRQRATSPRSK